MRRFLNFTWRKSRGDLREPGFSGALAFCRNALSMQPPIILLILSLLLPAAVVRADGPAEELRGAWIARFHWASPDGDKCRARISHLLDALAENHCNAVFFQVRGEAETLYPSSLEPWSPLVGPEGPGFDPLQFAVDEAHKRGIQLHAYVNPTPLRSMDPKTPPTDKRHLWYSHGPDSPEPWICVDQEGKPADPEYYYLSPGIPEVHVYARKAVLDLVRRYDVDGVHFDRMRYPGSESSHDPVSERRFREQGNPSRKAWADWQREQLDKLANDLAAEIREEKPGVAVSCAAWGIYNRNHIEGYETFSSGYHDYCQDTWNWARLGAMDFLVPMIYWDLADPKPNYDEVLADFVRGVGKEHVVGGQRAISPEENTRQIEFSRREGVAGTVFWHASTAEEKGILSHLKQTLYSSKVPVPKLVRLAAPATGTILGTVKAADGSPLVDAWVSIQPVDTNLAKADVFSRTWTSSADGRFAFLNVPSGQVHVTVRQRDDGTVKTLAVDVKRGDVTICEAVID